MLKYSKRYLPKESLIMLNRSLVEPYFRNCCPAFGDLAVYQPSTSCKNFEVELLGLSQAAPMTHQLCF